MGKNKVKDYLPLHWCKHIAEPVYKLFGDGFDPKDIRRFISSDIKAEEMRQILKKYPPLKGVVEFRNPEIIKTQGLKAAVGENLRDLDSMSLVLTWGLNKQVYKFDKDFTDELIRTDNVRLTKDMFDYLPFSVLYIDISDNKELCSTVGVEGLFISVERLSKDFVSKFINNNNLVEENLEAVENWCVHVCKVNEEHFFNDILFFPNEDTVLTDEDMSGSFSVPIYGENGFEGMRSYDGLKYEKLVLQALVYLSSTEPDIDETEQSKETYRVPSAVNKKPKNKFSEIRTWEVGVRYGSAFRKWKSESSHGGVSTGTGSKKRPHTRRAHWSYYWYGKRDGERVRRPKWIAETFVGVDKNNAKEQPAVIHKAINDNQKQKG